MDDTFCHVVNAKSEDIVLSSKTWSQLLQDASITADRLVALGVVRRQRGDSPVNISIRMRDSYEGFVVALGIWLNRLTVS